MYIEIPLGYIEVRILTFVLVVWKSELTRRKLAQLKTSTQAPYSFWRWCPARRQCRNSWETPLNSENRADDGCLLTEVIEIKGEIDCIYCHQTTWLTTPKLLPLSAPTLIVIVLRTVSTQLLPASLPVLLWMVRLIPQWEDTGASVLTLSWPVSSLFVNCLAYLN